MTRRLRRLAVYLRRSTGDFSTLVALFVLGGWGMIDVYFWPTPSGYKVPFLLEELGWKYNVIPVHIGKGAKFRPEFLKISPANKIPAVVDPDGPDGRPIAIFESGAIMMYLAEKSGWRFMPADLRRRYDGVPWVMFQMAAVGPGVGQADHFRLY